MGGRGMTVQYPCLFLENEDKMGGDFQYAQTA